MNCIINIEVEEVQRYLRMSFPRERTGADAAQNPKHLNELTADELSDVLSDMWDAMDENNYDPAQMDACLAELEKRDFDVDASLAAFQEKHARLFEQTPSVQLSTAAKPAHRRRWRTSLVAAIVAVAIRQYASAEDASIGIEAFEKDAANVTKYECNGIIHYILSNNSENVATWTNGALVCLILGGMTVGELKQMVDSIYRE